MYVITYSIHPFFLVWEPSPSFLRNHHTIGCFFCNDCCCLYLATVSKKNKSSCFSFFTFSQLWGKKCDTVCCAFLIFLFFLLLLDKALGDAIFTKDEVMPKQKCHEATSISFLLYPLHVNAHCC